MKKTFFIIFIFSFFNISKPVPVISDKKSKIIIATTSTLLASIITYKVYKDWVNKNIEKNDDKNNKLNSKVLLKAIVGVTLPIGISSAVIFKLLFYDYFSESAHWKKVTDSTSKISDKFLTMRTLNLNIREQKNHLKSLLDDLEKNAMEALTDLKITGLLAFQGRKNFRNLWGLTKQQFFFADENLDSPKNNDIAKEFYRVHGNIKKAIDALS